MSFSVLAKEALLKNEISGADDLIEKINSRQKFSNISLIVAVAGVALTVVALVFQILILIGVGSFALSFGAVTVSLIHIKERPEHLKAIGILQEMPDLQIQGGGKTLGLYLNAYSLVR